MSTWRNPDYRWWFLGDTSVAAALALRQFAVPLLAYGLSGSTALAGLLGTTQAVVSTLAALPGGVLIDRHDRRAMIRLHALIGLAIWGTVTALAALGTLPFWGFFALAALGSLFGGLFGHATDAALRTIVSSQEYPSAMATNQGRDAAVQLAAGPLGGLLYALAAWLPFGAALVGYVSTLASTFGVRADLRPPPYDRRSMLRDLGSAWAWMWARRRFRVLAPLFSAINVAFSGVIFTYQMSVLTRGLGPVAVGWLSGVLAASMIVGALVAGPLVQRFRTGTLGAVTTVWVAVALIPTAVTDSYPVMLACLGASGVLIPALNSGLIGFVFSKTPVELQGRVQTGLALMTGGLSALAPVAAGTLLPTAGYSVTVGLFVGLLAVCAIVSVFSDAVRSIPRPAQWEESAL